MKLTRPATLTRHGHGATLGGMDELMTYQEAAVALSVSRATLYRMVADGILTSVKVDRPSRRGTVPRLRSADVGAIAVPVSSDS